MTATRSVLLLHGMASSRSTWWRVGPLLAARGWDVATLDLAGHGGRPVRDVRSVGAIAADVVARHATGATLVVGHSLGAIVALEVVTSHPSYARGVLLEDPPAHGGRGAPGDPDRDVEREVDAARTDPDSAVSAVLLGHPTWTRRDARSVVEGRLLADPRLADLPRGALAWDLHASVSACPVPVALVAALGPYSALPEPDRSALLRLLPPARIAEFPGSHHVHLDHPDGWADAVDGFGASLL